MNRNSENVQKFLFLCKVSFFHSYIAYCRCSQKKGGGGLVDFCSLVLLFSKEQFFLLELPGIERMGNTNSFCLYKYWGESRLRHLRLLRPVWNHCICFNYSQRERRGWEGHEDSKCMRQIQPSSVRTTYWGSLICRHMALQQTLSR